jgi:hypothetical protein
MSMLNMDMGMETDKDVVMNKVADMATVMDMDLN